MTAIGAFLFAAPLAQAASPAPAWGLRLTTQPTNLAPGAASSPSPAAYPQYFLVATNLGAAATSGPITLTETLPSGITPATASAPFGTDHKGGTVTCGVADQTVTCVDAGSISPGEWVNLNVPVDVSGAIADPSTVTAIATVAGGGASSASVSSATTISSALPTFDFLPGAIGLGASATGADGSTVTEAGSHPYQLTLNFGFPTKTEEGGIPLNAGTLHDLKVDLPRGLIVNPAATPLCTETQLESLSSCPSSSQVGIVSVPFAQGAPVPNARPLYNMVPPPGTAAEFGFTDANVAVHIAGGVRAGDYSLSADSNDILALVAVFEANVQLWGSPSDPSHDAVRGECGGAPGPKKPQTCPVTPQTTPLLTMPTACSDSLKIEASADSWEDLGDFHSRSAQFTDANGNPTANAGCDALPFSPTLQARPNTSAAESPTGLSVDLHIPQPNDLNTLAEAHLRDAVVILPAGLAVNPSSANGLGACTEEQLGMKEGVPNGEPVRCPDSSKIGSVEVDTPLLGHPLPGAVYVAAPYNNPFDSLLAIYVVIDDPQTGVVLKLPGHVEADPMTGQLTTTFTENPELPFEDFKLDFFGGPRAALRTPSVCGGFSTESELSPWSGTGPVHTTDSFQVDQGANGGKCAFKEGEEPNAPSFEAGTLSPLAGSYSPLVGRLHREDGSQQFKGVNLTLPPGLSGKLAGIPQCSDAQIAAAAQKSGTAEQASPSCPAASEVGTVTVGAGAGSQPYYTTGKIYLAGPYKGAPLSVAAITPAVAGPYDLGNVVVRAAAHVDPITAVITVNSDPLPTILDGIPLQVRDVRVNMGRPDFTLNPTSCEPMSVSGESISPLGAVAPLSSRFQAAGCAGLAFKPKLALRLKGPIKRGGTPALTAVLTQPAGQADIAKASVALPHSEFLDQAHIRTVCTRVQFAEGAGGGEKCPPGAVYGEAEATTPLLEEKLSGPVYLRSSSNQLPDLVAVLRGPASRPLEVVLDGRVDSIHGGIRNSFEAVPDQPVSKFVLRMQGGKKGLLENSRNLCKSTNKAIAEFTAQNGKSSDGSVLVRNQCKKPKRHAKRSTGRK